ncbi:MAG: cytochrome c [Gemmatimonadetes bacterium]|nr:cytochrome c [Gemmatimonadota bacterium]
MLLVLLLTGGVAACTALDNFLASIPVFSFLREAPFFDPYEAPRPAPAGAVPSESPAGEVLPPVAPTHAALQAFGATVANPVADAKTLARGQLLYQRQCFVCHGPAGKGDGPVVTRPGDQPGSKFPFAPNLTAPNVVQYTDGYLYGIIRAGRGLMPPYGERLSHLERWYVVNYVRQLQRGAAAATATPAAAAAASAPARR